MASLDNLMKGQSGNALQNLNLMFGLDPAKRASRACPSIPEDGRARRSDRRSR